MRRSLFLSFFVLGITSLISQVLILREVGFLLFSNEIFLGMALTFWLFWTGVASKISEKIFLRFTPGNLFLVSLKITLALLLMGEIFLLRYLRQFLGLPGESVNIVKAGLISLFSPLVPSLFLGIWWSSALFLQKKFSPEYTNLAYFAETIGFFTAGLGFTFFLAKKTTFEILFWVFSIALLSAMVFLSKKQKVAFLFLLVFAFFFLTSYHFLPKLEAKTMSFVFHGQKIAEIKNSPYGNLVVTKLGNNFFLYENGSLRATNFNIASYQKFPTFALLFHPYPRKVLVVGGGFQGGLQEALKQTSGKVYYAEIDPYIIETFNKYLKKEEFLQEEKLVFLKTDGRYFLKTEPEKSLHVVLINLSGADSLITASYFTRQFFSLVKRALSPDGIFAIHLPYSMSFAGENFNKEQAFFYQNLKKVFSDVALFSEQDNILIASNAPLASFAQLKKRLEERKIKSPVFNENYLKYRFFNQRNKKVKFLFEKEPFQKKLYSFGLLGFFYHQLYQLERTAPFLAKLFKTISFLFLPLIIAGALIVIILAKKTPGAKFLTSAFLAGFSLMVFETLLFFEYQTTLGYLYSHLSILVGVLMLGMALGVFLINQKKVSLKKCAKIHLWIGGIASGLILLFWVEGMIKKIFIIQSLFFGASFLSGISGGALFAASNKLYLTQFRKKLSTPYSADLFGSALGVLATSFVLFPLFGGTITLLTLLLFHLMAMVFLYR